MSKLFQYLQCLSIWFSVLLVLPYSAQASVSELTKGNPRRYEKAENLGSLYKTSVDKSKTLDIQEAFLIFRGPDLDKGQIQFKMGEEKGSLSIKKARLGKGGVFNCEGTLEIGGAKEMTFFDIKLDPIKDGFLMESSMTSERKKKEVAFIFKIKFKKS